MKNSAPVVDSAEDGRSSRWNAHRSRRRTALIKSARKAIHRLGPGASMEEIASSAGTSKSVFYRYFGDKAGLQQAMGELVIGQMQEKLVAAARAADTPREGLHAMVSAYLQMAETSPHVYAFVTRTDGVDALSNPSGSPVSGTMSHFFASIRQMMEEPMRTYLQNQPAAYLQTTLAYWPTAAIGHVRAAGELWLGTADGPDKPGREDMAENITRWLFAGISNNSQDTGIPSRSDNRGTESQ
ncbi:TetR/AcrR family transcriptional regulator [Arthrobacter castelli]|uniref:TetR/AcrR family transcriptional regulator n=1 Tax=Arthrobacter castelli TaxID=271431 RepID=UPI0003FCBC5D|nr:TetR/AcrR family transcriptional regulator [Arthrobacter castelli]